MNHERTAASMTALLAFPETSFGTAAPPRAGAVPSAKLPSFENQSGQALRLVNVQLQDTTVHCGHSDFVLRPHPLGKEGMR